MGADAQAQPATRPSCSAAIAARPASGQRCLAMDGCSLPGAAHFAAQAPPSCQLHPGVLQLQPTVTPHKAAKMYYILIIAIGFLGEKKKIKPSQTAVDQQKQRA